MLPEGLRLASVLVERAVVHQWMRNKKALQTRGCIKNRAGSSAGNPIQRSAEKSGQGGTDGEVDLIIAHL